MRVHEMRKFLRKLYKGAPKWVKKVNAMSESQVIAVYYAMKTRGVH